MHLRINTSLPLVNDVYQDQPFVPIPPNIHRGMAPAYHTDISYFFLRMDCHADRLNFVLLRAH